MNTEKIVLFLIGVILVLLFAILFNMIVFTDKYTYRYIDLPENSSLTGICKDGKVLQGLRCDPEITCCQ
jgi:hypothetical protein